MVAFYTKRLFLHFFLLGIAQSWALFYPERKTFPLNSDETNTTDNGRTFAASIVREVGFGRFNFYSIPTAFTFSSMALDVRDMSQAQTNDGAIDIYENGLNAFHTSYSRQGSAITLASFSTDAASFMSKDPMFNIFKYALYEDTSLENDAFGAFSYADEIVRELLLGTEDNYLAAEAAVVLNVWMMIAHELYNAIRACKAGGNGKPHIDSAVALWIGRDQVEGSFSDGWLVYSVAQRAAMGFGLEEGEASVNTELFRQFNEIQALMEECHEDVHIELRVRVNFLLRSLSIPLFQQLLISIASDDPWHVELYTAAVISQCSSCSSKVYHELSEVLSADFSRDQVSDEVIENLAIFMQCMRISCQDLQYSNQATSELQSLVDDICMRMDEISNQYELMPYFDDGQNLEKARVDLDILQIGIFMRTQAFDVALDYYQNGWNSFVFDTMGQNNENKWLLSLQSLANIPNNFENDQMAVYSEFFDSKTYTDDLINQCILRRGAYNLVSRVELANIVVTILQAMVSHNAVVQQFALSIQACRDRSEEEAGTFWNNGVAFFLGSINVFASDDRSTSDGFFLYSLGQEYCSKFGTCSGKEASKNNEALFVYFREVQDFLAKGLCDEADNLLVSSILPSLRVPLIQGMLYHSIVHSENESLESDGYATGYILSQSIIPLIAEANSNSGQVISDAFSSPLQPITGSATTEAVFQATRDALTGMQIECEQIGKSIDRPDLPLCSTYFLPSYARNYANIALDVEEMSIALSAGSVNIAQLIYTNGQNSFETQVDSSGLRKLRSLQSLSISSTKHMLGEPLFNRFLYTYANEHEKKHENISYADTFVQEALQTSSDSSKTLAAEAVVALNIWMYLVHVLYATTKSCKDARQDVDFEKGIDQAAAYWIGDAEVGVTGGRGHLLYGLAEQTNEHFGTNDETMSRVNARLFELFAEAKDALRRPDVCVPHSKNLVHIHSLVNEIISQISIPLVQSLIHNLLTNDRDRVRLYSHAVIPLISVCHPSDYDFLRGHLIDGNYEADDVNEIIDRIYKIIPCLGISCSEIGIHVLEVENETKTSRCISSTENGILGYQSGGEFYQNAQLDLDLREIDILMQLKAYKAAEEIYVYGTHAKSSLADIAMNRVRSFIPEFELFSSYYQSPFYAHNIVMGALDGTYTEGLTDSQRRLFVLKFSQTLVMEQTALGAMYEAVEICDAEQDSEGRTSESSWNEAAGILLGSVERNKLSDSENWYAPYDLAQRHCKEFGTCGPSDVAFSNERLVERLNAGRNALHLGNCNIARTIIVEVASILRIPIIQALLSASLGLSPSSRSDEDVAEAYIFSRTLLPLIEDIDGSVATSVEGAAALGGAFDETSAYKISAGLLTVYEELAIACGQIGRTADFDPCNIPITPGTKPKGPNTGIIVGSILIALAIMIVIAAIIWDRKEAKELKRILAEENSYSSDEEDSDSAGSIDPKYKSFRNYGFSISSKADDVLRSIYGYGDDTPVVGEN